MSPIAEALKVPDHLSLERRPLCAPASDELYLLRDTRGNVRATVEMWSPEDASN